MQFEIELEFELGLELRLDLELGLELKLQFELDLDLLWIGFGLEAELLLGFLFAGCCSPCVIYSCIHAAIQII